MKATVKRIIRFEGQSYKLEKDREIPDMPAKAVQALRRLGYVEQEKEVKPNASNAN